MTFPHIAQPIKIFFSYASSKIKDKNLFYALKNHLIVFKVQGRIETLYDKATSPGSDWRHILNSHIDSANIIVLLISADFFASDRCRDIEMKRASERSEAGTARVISVLLRPVNWIGFPIDQPGLLPPDGKAISQWQDKEAALLVVAKEICNAVEEIASQLVQAIRSLDDPKNPMGYILYRRNPFFTGREEILTMLHNSFSFRQTSRTLIQALNGLGGMGKTQLAIEYAYKYQNEYQDIFWVRAVSHDLFSADIALLADRLSLAEKFRSDESRLLVALKHWLQHHSMWLLLIDDMEDFDLIDQLVPSQCRGHVLLTTRFQATGAYAHAITVTPMTHDEGALFLLRRIKKITEQVSHDEATTFSDYSQAREIAQEVDGFPLALDQAGAYIEETQRTLTEYLSLYRLRRASLLQLRGQFANGHSQSVTATFSLTFDNVVQKYPPAIELLRLFAFLHPDTIPDELVTPGVLETADPLQPLAADPLVLDKAIAILLSFSLVHHHSDSTTLSIHRLVQDVLRDSLSLEEQRQWATRAIYLVNHLFPEEGYFRFWPLCDRYLTQAQRCAQYISDFHFTFHQAAQLLYRLGCYRYERAFYSEAEKYLALALAIFEQESGAEQLDMANNLKALALLANKQGNCMRAIELQKRALAIYEQILGPDDPDTAAMLNNLALFYQELGNYDLAEPLYLRVLALYGRTLGPTHIETATTLGNLALLYQELGNYDLAESHYLRALSIRETALDASDPDIAQILNNLATLYEKQKKYLLAEPLLQRALRISEETLGPEHPDTAQSLNNLAVLFRHQGKYQEAETLYLRALSIDENIFGPEHPDLAQYLSNLAFLYRLQGDYTQAETLYLRALSINEQTFGEMHPETAMTLNNLGRLYRIQADYPQAEFCLKRAVAINEQVLGSEHPDTALSLSNLAELLTFQANYSQAELLYLRVLAIYEHILGSEHLDIANIMEKYAYLLTQMERIAEATALQQSARIIKNKHSSGPPISNI